MSYIWRELEHQQVVGREDDGGGEAGHGRGARGRLLAHARDPEVGQVGTHAYEVAGAAMPPHDKVLIGAALA
eukprot:scaffold64926_cov60-Phaeocystis_antarctica.AAC.2